MDSVFLLWHIHKTNDTGDEKLIGVYRTEQDAKDAIERHRNLPGFVDAPNGFEIAPYALNVDHWTEGFIFTTD